MLLSIVFGWCGGNIVYFYLTRGRFPNYKEINEYYDIHITRFYGPAVSFFSWGLSMIGPKSDRKHLNNK